MQPHQLSIPPNPGMSDYKGLLRIQVRWDDIVLNINQGPGLISIPESPVEPLVTLQTVNNGNQAWGDVWVYNYPKEKWVIYDEELHPIPQSESQPPIKMPFESKPSHVLYETTRTIEDSDESEKDADKE